MDNFGSLILGYGGGLTWPLDHLIVFGLGVFLWMFVGFLVGMMWTDLDGQEAGSGRKVTLCIFLWPLVLVYLAVLFVYDHTIRNW